MRDKMTMSDYIYEENPRICCLLSLRDMEYSQKDGGMSTRRYGVIIDCKHMG